MRSYVYIMTNRSKTLYTGVTSDLEKRCWEHKKWFVRHRYAPEVEKT
jgi:predicted GIY-YIG superfamily endonuclease